MMPERIQYNWKSAVVKSKQQSAHDTIIRQIYQFLAAVTNEHFSCNVS